MASYTTNLNLKKPAGSESVSIGDINNNMDMIDQAYGTLNNKLGKQVQTETFTGTSNSDSVVSVPTTINGKSTGTASISIVSMECSGSTNIICVPFRGTGSAWKARLTMDTGSTVSQSERSFRFYYVDL